MWPFEAGLYSFGARMIKQSLFAISMLSLCGAAVADESSKYYVEAGYGAIQYKESGLTATPGVGTLRFGVNIDKHLSVEGLLGTTITDATGLIGTIPLTIKIENVYGVYLKAKTEIAPNLQVFGRLGYMHATISASIPGYSLSQGGSDVSYGIGAQYSFTPTIYGQLDYMSYYNKNGATANGPSVSLGLKF